MDSRAVTTDIKNTLRNVSAVMHKVVK